ncbi:MAG: 7TM domain-containing protein [Candidatus Andersenbacteria bacterium]
MHPFRLTILILFLLTSFTKPALAQEESSEEEEQPQPTANVTISSSQVIVGKVVSFDIGGSFIPENDSIQEVVWNFGDGIRSTGERVTHAYNNPGSYTVQATIRTEQGVAEDTAEITVFEHAMVLLTDGSAPEDQVELKRRQAADNDLLLLVLRSTGGPEVVVEEELTNQLIDARDTLARSEIVVTWTSGSVGPTVLSKFAQRVRQAEEISFSNLSMAEKGVIILSETPFGVLAPSAQSTFNQLAPSYVLLTRPRGLDLLLDPLSPEQARQAIFDSPISLRLLGTFSQRAITDLSPTNFMSFGINYLINQGVPVSNITLILILPVIATILSFARQVIGLKAFGIITPAMTTLSFLVLGLQYGLVIFSAVLLAGTLTRLVLRKLHLLYLPRMALVLTMASISMLILFGLGIAVNNTAILSFSIFPILILVLLAEEFIAVQFKSGARRAATITAWTLGLSILSYFIVSWEIVRSIIVSYPEIVLLAIPINIALGRWSGLRLTEYFRFRRLLRYVQ